MICLPFGYGSELQPCCMLIHVCKKGRSFFICQHNISKMLNVSKAGLGALESNARAYTDKEFNRDTLIAQLEDWSFEVTQNNTEKKI